MRIDPALVNETILAVDIGNEGGLVFNRAKQSRLGIYRMPEFVKELWLLVEQIKPTIIIAENVHSMPNQGVVAIGTLMKNRGRLEGVAAAAGINPKFIEPLRWMECYTLKRTKHFPTKTQWKNHLIGIAKGLVNENEKPFIDKRTADAFLIWNFAASQYTTTPMRPLGQFQF